MHLSNVAAITSRKLLFHASGMRIIIEFHCSDSPGIISGENCIFIDNSSSSKAEVAVSAVSRVGNAIRVSK